jgi:hypothetical protein
LSLRECFAVERAVPEALEHTRENVVWLRARDEHPLIDQPGWDAAGAKFDRGPRLHLDALQVPPVSQGVDDLAFVDPDGGSLLDQDALVADVTAPRPVGVKQARVKRVERAPLAREFGEHQRATRVRHLVERLCVWEPGSLKHHSQAIGKLRAVAALKLGTRDALWRVLGVQIKRSPLDPRAEPALKPRRPLKADVAERSYVVAPGGDQRDTVDYLGHSGHCRDHAPRDKRPMTSEGRARTRLRRNEGMRWQQRIRAVLYHGWTRLAAAAADVSMHDDRARHE